MDHVTINTTLSVTICCRCAGTSYNSAVYQFKISRFTHYEDTKGDEAEIGVVLGLRVTQGQQKHIAI